MAMRNDLLESNDYVRLWLAVIALAIEDASSPVIEEAGNSPPGVPYSEAQWDQRRAHLWLQNSEQSVGSLNWICSMLNLDAEAVRNEYKRRVRARDARQDGNSHRINKT